MTVEQVKADIELVEMILPAHYDVKPGKKEGSIHCVSNTGIRKKPYAGANGIIIDDDEDEKAWRAIVRKVKNQFGERFQEIFHNVCFCHKDFTIYLKP